MVPLTSEDSVTGLNLTYVLVYQYWGTVCSEICIDFNRAHQISEATYCQWNQSYCMSCNWKQWIINIAQMRWIKLKHGSTLGDEHSQLTLNMLKFFEKTQKYLLIFFIISQNGRQNFLFKQHHGCSWPCHASSTMHNFLNVSKVRTVCFLVVLNNDEAYSLFNNMSNVWPQIYIYICVCVSGIVLLKNTTKIC